MKIKVILTAMLAVVLGMSLTACSNDDDDKKEDAKDFFEVKYAYHVDQSSSDIFSIKAEWYDADGNLQTKDLTSGGYFNMDVKYDLKKAKNFGFRITQTVLYDKFQPNTNYHLETYDYLGSDTKGYFNYSIQGKTYNRELGNHEDALNINCETLEDFKKRIEGYIKNKDFTERIDFRCTLTDDGIKAMSEVEAQK